jgi:hypothetical protein
MKEYYTDGYTAYVKYFIIAALVAAWVLAAWTGFMLGVVPYTTGSENGTFMLGFTRAELNIIHSWLSVIAVCITIVEIIITRKYLREEIIYLTEPDARHSSDRRESPLRLK